MEIKTGTEAIQKECLCGIADCKGHKVIDGKIEIAHPDGKMVITVLKKATVS